MGRADKDLNDKQEMALKLVLCGMNDGEIAKWVVISQQWVNKWRNYDVEFMDTLQVQRQILREKHIDSLSQLVEL